MPSTNYNLHVTSGRRISINKCEGQITLIVQESQNGDGRVWFTKESVLLTTEQAMLLVDRLNNALRG